MQLTPLLFAIFFLNVYCNVVGSNVSLRIFPNSLIVSRVDDTLNITCEILANDAHPLTYNLEWVVPTLLDSAVLRRNVTRHHNALTLHISQLQETDSGVYVCNASTKGDVLLMANVTVTVKPKKGTCSQNFFMCGSKDCIARRFLCDGLRDCPDGSDESESYCGTDPCKEKIHCDDGRCLNRNDCCHPSLDTKCRGYHLQCCSKYLEKFSMPIKVMDDDKRYESDMGFLQSTIYTIIGCAVAFIFIVTIMVVAVCRVHMKQTAMTASHPRTLVARSALYWAHRPPHDVDTCFPVGGQRSLHRVPYPPSTNLLVTYNINNGIQLVGRIVEPPPYSEVVLEPSVDGPPPPYTSTDNLQQLSRDTAVANVNSAPRGQAMEFAGQPNSALLRPNVLVSRADEAN